MAPHDVETYKYDTTYFMNYTLYCYVTTQQWQIYIAINVS